jgi:hypothetical protein
LALMQRVENDLRALDRLHIKPVFIFPGLPIASGGRPLHKGMDSNQEREMAVKNEAWTWYENGQVEKSITCLNQIRGGAWAEWRDLIRAILKIFRYRMVEYVMAPYLEYAQVSLEGSFQGCRKIWAFRENGGGHEGFRGVHSRMLVELNYWDGRSGRIAVIRCTAKPAVWKW